MNFKHELSPSKPLLRSTLSLILGTAPNIPSDFCLRILAVLDRTENESRFAFQ